MKHSLLEILVEDEVNDDLVYYLIGILTFKPVHMLPWDKNLKAEINDFLSWVRGYSKMRFYQVFKSKSLVILCEHIFSMEVYNEQLDIIRDLWVPTL